MREIFETVLRAGGVVPSNVTINSHEIRARLVGNNKLIINKAHTMTYCSLMGLSTCFLCA